MKRAVIAMLVLGSIGTAWAHPGHATGSFVDGLLHPFSGIDHLLATLAVGFVCGRQRIAGAVALAAGLLAGAALALGGVALAAELLALLSVAALIVACAAAGRLGVPVLLAAAVVLSVPHGYLHALESGGAAWIVGLALGTSMLYAVGVSAARVIASRARAAAPR
ncbi:MAG TPA: HupE/UreJ family protein [Burkholderiaceae bacterium]|nr:HupE/UreJ family protein [Burkholderiaceae bacterium]